MAHTHRPPSTQQQWTASARGTYVKTVGSASDRAMQLHIRTHTHTHTHTHTTHFVFMDPVSWVTGLYSESSPLGAFAIVVSDLPHRPHLHQAVQREVTILYSLGTSTVNQECTNMRALMSNLSSNVAQKASLGVKREFFTTIAINIVDVCAVMQTWLLPAHC